MKLSLYVVAALAFAPLPIRAQRLPSPTTAVTALSSSITFGMAGMAAGQTARLNALNLAAGGPIVVGVSCQITVTFLDASGKTLASQTVAVGQGQAVHVDLLRSQADAGADPVEIRATVSTALIVSPVATTPVAASCSIVPTLEIFDQATGRTAAHLETTHALASVVPLTASPN